MKQEEINDYNHRCAEFLGLKRGWWISQQKPLTDDKKQWCDLDGKTFLGSKVYFDKDLKFHSDWNWIIEVVEAIEKLPDLYGRTNCRYVFNISSDALVDNKHNVSITHSISKFPGFVQEKKVSIYRANTKKEAVVETINQFLIWYNNENNKK